MKNKIQFIILTSLFLAVNSYTQTLEEEIGFIYVKAEYLFETSRYDEAVTQYNLVIRQDPAFKDALIKRGIAKNSLGAYKGGKQDVLQFIDLKGITGLAAAALAKAEIGLGQSEAALNNLNAAIGLLPSDSELLLLRARIYESEGQLLKACSDYEKAMNAGSAQAEAKAKSLCGITTKTKPSNNTPSKIHEPDADVVPGVESYEKKDSAVTQPVEEENKIKDAEETSNNAVQEGGTSGSGVDNAQVVDDPTIPKEDNTLNKLQIDDDLTIEIYGQGLGKRKIEEIPSILILADEDGEVCLDICVDNKGNVTKAEFNPSLSTTAKKSMVSLAIRKSREFTFEPAVYTAQCGVMVFKIKGS